MGNKSPEKIWVSAANNYYVDNQQDDNLGAYIHADKVDELLEQQRQACVDATIEIVKPMSLHPDVINACRNARIRRA